MSLQLNKMTGNSRHTASGKPQRSCLGCRITKDNDQLLRFVLTPDREVWADLDVKLPGRGAYTCISNVCVRDAVQKRQFNRSFKDEIQLPSVEILVSNITERLQSRILGYIGLANKAGKLTSGGSMVSDAIRSPQKPGLILLAGDVSESIAVKIESVAAHNSVPCLRIMTKDDFGAIIGKAPRSALAIKQSGFVAQLIYEINRYRNFLGEVR